MKFDSKQIWNLTVTELRTGTGTGIKSGFGKQTVKLDFSTSVFHSYFSIESRNIPGKLVLKVVPTRPCIISNPAPLPRLNRFKVL